MSSDGAICIAKGSFFDEDLCFFWWAGSWKRFEIFIMRSLEDGSVGGVRFSKWRQIKSVAKCKYLFPSILP